MPAFHKTTLNSNRWKILALAFCIYLPFVPDLMPESRAQNIEELRFLVFEPVLIESVLVDDELQVSEITSLPTDDAALTASEFIFSRLLEDNKQPDTNTTESISAYEESIKQLELSGGAYEPALSQELIAVAMLHQSQNEHAIALEYLDKALHVNRVNLGLFNLEQEQIIDHKIESHIALGNLQEADSQQEYLFYLKRKAYGSDSVELLPTLGKYAEWNVFAFDSRLSMNSTLSYAAESEAFNSNLIGVDDFRTARLINAQIIYRAMIQIILNNYGTTDTRLLDIEKKLAITNYFFATNLDLSSSAISNGNFSAQAGNTAQGFYDMSRVSSNSLGYRHGRDALERRLSYMYSMRGLPAEEITKALIELGDWLLIFKKRKSALEMYQQIYIESKANGLSQETLDRIFTPPLPETLPTFIDYRFSRATHNIPENQALEYHGWFDVKLIINRFGQPEEVEIFGRSEQANESAEFYLLRHLRNSTSFRPRFSNAELITEETIELRYYYSY